MPFGTIRGRGAISKRSRLFLDRAVGARNGRKSAPRGETSEIQKDNVRGHQERSQDYKVMWQHGIRCLFNGSFAVIGVWINIWEPF
jgi:hypothetical protein